MTCFICLYKINLKWFLLSGMVLLFNLFTMSSVAQKPIFHSNAFSIFADRVEQGKYTAIAKSAEELTSNYQSSQESFYPAKIEFKFSINGSDNEMPFGQNHEVAIGSGDKTQQIPLIVFGKKTELLSSKNDSLPYNKEVTFRVDMREVLHQFQTKGYYITSNGSKIYKQDFRGVFIAGNVPPLTWDFDNLQKHGDLELKDADGDGIYELTLMLNRKEDEKSLASKWKLSKDISSYPQMKSSYVLSDALYNLSLEEMVNAIEPDSTFRTGKLWAGVWTRDISYSIILSMAYLQPQVAMKSLMKKVNNKGKIIQDTGTGGAYPISTDRMIWATAAWEVFLITGDTAWLRKSFEIIQNSIEDDLVNAYDFNSGMARGESSFLDWREQTYPRWIQPADIYESECLGTNSVHYSANIVLAKMADILGDTIVAEKHRALAEKIKDGMNKFLWMADKNYYGQYLYGRNSKILSPRAEALGEALSVLFGIANNEKSSKIISSVPITPFGITCIYPQIPDVPPYHNNAIWPFVQSYWALASAKVGNEKSVMESIAAIYRPAALFLTNKENFVAQNGDYAGTQVNSSNMLWSLSGNIALVYKILFGIEFHPDKISFHSLVPKNLEGKRTLKNFKYRNAVLDIEVNGFGNKIKAFYLDGKQQNQNEFPAVLTGKHSIRIMLTDTSKLSSINLQPNAVSPATPEIDSDKFAWKKVAGADHYLILNDGIQIGKTKNLFYEIDSTETGEFQVIAVATNSLSSFASEPFDVYPDRRIIVEAEDFNPPSKALYSGYSKTGFCEISVEVNTTLSFKVNIKNDGLYAIDFRYANGNGPINTENKCAIRSLNVDDHFSGAVVFPQRGSGEWSNWGFSNSVKVKLSKGEHVIQLILTDHNENMNEKINQAMIDFMRLTRLTQ